MTDRHSGPAFSELVKVFARIGCLSFGGPAGQIALLHHEVVDERGWVEEQEFLEALNFCHLLPGPEAQQLATWIGWKLAGVRGGIAAGGLFILPGALVMLALSIAYGHFAGADWFAGVFLGIKAAVLSIIVQALLRIGGRSLDAQWKRVVALGAFAALFFFNAPFPLVIVLAGAIGVAMGRGTVHHSASRPQGGIRQACIHSAMAVAIFGLLWALPMIAIALTLGTGHRLWHIGAYFSQLAVVTFGGAYAVLAYMAQATVTQFHWLAPGAMVDGLGLAETTPGPLILVTQFVGYLASANAPAPFTPFVAGVLGALLTSWVTFVPCFLWIFAFAPWIEQLRHARHLKAALSAMTAAVVGVIANLSLWFALHVLFRDLRHYDAGPLHLQWPTLPSVDIAAVALSALGALLLFGARWPVVRVLLCLALAGLALSRLG